MTKLTTKSEKAAVAVLPTNKGMIAIADVAASIAARHVIRQTRALGVPLPSILFFEPTGKKMKSETGQIANAIYTGYAQIFDTNNARKVGFAPSLPRLDLFAKTGNAYNKAYDEASGDYTTPRWQQYVALSHAVFAHVKALKAAFTAGDIAKTVCGKAGVGLDKSGNVSGEAANCIVDTLRDLRQFGLVFGDYVNEQTSRTSWLFNADSKAITVLAKASKAMPVPQPPAPVAVPSALTA